MMNWILGSLTGSLAGTRATMTEELRGMSVVSSENGTWDQERVSSLSRVEGEGGEPWSGHW